MIRYIIGAFIASGGVAAILIFFRAYIDRAIEHALEAERQRVEAARDEAAAHVAQADAKAEQVARHELEDVARQKAAQADETVASFVARGKEKWTL